MTGIMKAQIDWIPLALGGVRPTQGKTLAVMEVSGGSQSFNAVNQMRILGRWMRMITIPNQSSVPKAFTEFDDRSEERRVGKECRSRRSTDKYKNKQFIHRHYQKHNFQLWQNISTASES